MGPVNLLKHRLIRKSPGFPGHSEKAEWANFYCKIRTDLQHEADANGIVTTYNNVHTNV